ASEPYQSQANYLYRLPSGPGRAWLVGRVESADDGQASLAAVVADGFDPRHVAILEGAAPGIGSGLSAAGDVQDVRVGWSDVTLRAQSQTDAYLVLAQAAYPGWTARVDGLPTEL